MFKKILPFILSAVSCNPLLAQAPDATVTGTVKTADGQPAEFINVTLKGTHYGAVTDAKGEFKFQAPGGEYTMYVFSILAHRTEVPVTIKPGTVNNFPYLSIIEKELELNEVVVTGTRTEKRLSESPVLTTLIRDKDIRKAAATSTLESLQDNVPGIVSSQNGMGNNLRIRGLNSRYILFLADGERLVPEGAGGNINLDQIDVDNIKRIEMVDGASSALYGSNAVGAVINIITKEPVHGVEAGANQSYGNHNTLRSRVDFGSSHKGFMTRAGGFRNSSDGFGGDGDGPYAAKYVDYGGNLKLGCKPTGKSDVTLSGNYFRHESWNPEGSMNVKHPLTENMTIGAHGGFTSPDSKNSLRASINFDKYFKYDVLEKKDDEQKLTNTASYLSARMVNTFTPTVKWEFVGGLEYNREENYSVKNLGSEPTNKSIDDANVFAQAECKLTDNFDIIGGARYTYNSQFGSALTPKLSLMYGIAGFKFRGGVGSAFRAPSIKELYYDFDHQGMFWVYGNPGLKAEKGLYTSLSVEYSNGSFNASASGYHNNIDNKITQYTVINSQGGKEEHYENTSSATLRGMDVNAVYTLFKELTLKGSYSFCNAVDNATGLQLPSNVKHSGTAAITWNGNILQSPFSLQFAGRLNSPILYQEAVTANDGTQSTVEAESKAYSIWKIALVKPFNIKKKHILEITFKIDNLFDFNDAAFVNPGRQYMVGLRYNFNTKINK